MLIFAALGLVATGLTSCKATLDAGGPYKGNQVVFSADNTVAAAYKAVHAFLVYEMKNRSSVPVSVSQAADQIRAKAQRVFAAYDAARVVYLASPTPQSQASLDAVLIDISSLVAAVSNYSFSK